MVPVFPLRYSNFRAYLIVILAAGLFQCSQKDTRPTAGKPGKDISTPIIRTEKCAFASTISPAESDSLQVYVDAKKGLDHASKLTMVYPNEGSIFPPEIVAPTITWKNPADTAHKWLIEFIFQDSGRITVLLPSQGQPAFDIDPEINPEGKKLPIEISPDLSTWTPPINLWNFLKGRTVGKPCRVTLTGFSSSHQPTPILAGGFTFQTSSDPIGAPIFYRDVPFIPVLNRSAESVLPLEGINMKFIKWRLRDISRAESKVVMKDMPTCANCHTFSQNGKWLGMDIDGPQGDKGAYGIQKVSRQMVYNRSDIVSWNYDFKGKRTGKTLGFLTSISPDANFAVTTVNEKLYTAGFHDPAFSQVFFPTRGILAYYSKESGEALPLPGADNPEYVHCSPTWTPDGKTIIFSRAIAKDPFTKNQKLPAKANDPEETEIQYDLYSIPFNGGKGGTATPIAGAGQNGKSNNFSKVTPDGKYLIWVQCRNGLLMRPDSKLWILPLAGGEPRMMSCNTSLMNSWHSISPNSRWMVFSSKHFSPYTQLFLTHLNEDGSDSPFILLPNSTADNRAANLPEFANISYDDLDNIDAPAVSHFRYQYEADRLIRAGAVDSGIKLLQKALDEEKRDLAVRAEIMVTLGEIMPNPDDVFKILQTAIRSDSNYSQIYFDLGLAYEKRGDEREAIASYKKCLTKNAGNYLAMVQLVKIYMASENPAMRNLDSALHYAEQSNLLTFNQKAYLMENLARVYSELERFDEAVEAANQGVLRAQEIGETDLVERIKGEAIAFKNHRKFTSMITRQNP